MHPNDFGCYFQAGPTREIGTGEGNARVRNDPAPTQVPVRRQGY